MLSKKSYFDMGIFLKTVQRFWPIAVLYLGIWAFMMPMTFVGYYSYHDTAIDIVRQIPQGSVIMTAICGCVSALAVFSYLYNLRASVMYHSLPVKRQAMFVSNYAAGLSFMIVPNVLIYVLTLLVVMFKQGLNADVFAAAGIWLIATSLMGLFFYSFATLLAMIVGTWFMMPVVYGILNFTAVVIESIVHAALDVLIYGYQAGQTVMTVFSPVVYMMSEFRFYKWENSYRYLYVESRIWIYMTALTMLAIAMTILSMYVYKKRNMETAGDIITVKPLQPVFKYCFASGCAIVIGAFMYGILGFDNGFAMYLFALIGGAIGYLVAAMALRKSFRLKKSAIKGYAVFAAVVTLLFCAVSLDLFGVEKYMPAASRVDNAIISIEGEQLSVERGDISLAELMSIHRTIVAQKDEDERTRNTMYSQEIATSYSHRSTISVNVTYYTKWRTVKRHYSIPITDVLVSEPGTAQYMMREKLNSTSYMMKKYSWAFDGTEPYQVTINMYSLREYEDKYDVYYDTTKEDILAATTKVPEILDWSVGFADAAHISSLLDAFRNDVLAGQYYVLANNNNSMGGIDFYFIKEEPYADADGNVQYSKTDRYLQIYEGTQLYELAVQYLIEANTPKQ